MRRLALAVCVAALAGCGSSEQPAAGPPRPAGDFGPSKPGTGERARPVAPPKRAPPAAVARALEAGTAGVMGVEGDVGVRPRTLDVSADGRLERLAWTRWDASGARASGRLRLRDCDPTCASGGTDELPVTVKLSAPRLCGRETYFDRAEVTIAGQDPPATYVRAPC